MELVCEIGTGVPIPRNDEEKSREIYHIKFYNTDIKYAKN